MRSEARGQLVARRFERPVLLAMALLIAVGCLAPSGTGAVTLMVNGSTPSVRWQGVVNRSLAPLPAGDATLFLAACPSAIRPEGEATACVDIAGPAVTIWLLPDDAGYMREALMHEIGHVFDAHYLTSADREEFRLIWRRPGISWWEPLRPFSVNPEHASIQGAGTTGIPSSAAEWFASAYAWCATEVPTKWQYWSALGLGYIADEYGTSPTRMATAYRRGRQSCHLIESAARRAHL